MELIPTLLHFPPSPFLPTSLLSWLGWFVFLGILIWLCWNWRTYQAPRDSRTGPIFWGLLLLSLLGLFLGIRLPAGASQPGIPQETLGPSLMFFSALSWFLAGGILGPIVAAGLGLLAGTLRFVFDSRSIFSPLEYALLAILVSVAVRQRYRTLIFRLLRQPLVAAMALSALYVPLSIIDTFLAVSDKMALADRLIYTLSNVQYPVLAMTGELLVAGLIAQVLAVTFPERWRRLLPVQPSPGERSLEARFLFGTGTIIIVLLLALLVGDWWVAGNAAQGMLHDRMKGAAEVAAQSVPFFLETGQNLASQFSTSPRLLTASGSELTSLLGEQIRVVPYFDQLIVLDQQKNVVGSYPAGTPADSVLLPEESTGVTLSFNGVLSQTYSIPAAAGQTTARVSFLSAVINPATGQPERVLVARTNLTSNPFTLPLINGLKSMSELGGKGILLDENGRIIYHPDQMLIMTIYPDQRQTDTPAFYDATAADGTQNLVYVQPVTGHSWSVVLTVPAQQAQQLALGIAAPLSIMILILAFIALFSLRLALKVVTNSLQNLTSEAMRIAQGQLDHALSIEGVDEVGQLRRSFEQMRVSLQLRLEELNRLLLVSQGVASSLDMRDAVQPVLEAVLATGASSVRVVIPSLSQDADEQGLPTVYALGPSRDLYYYLDDGIIQLAKQQERLVLTNVLRVRGLDIRADRPYPPSLLAVPLRHENQYYGVLWAGYDQARPFSESDVRFLTTLAGQAALAASNNHLFRSAEVGRQRLAAILASTPDPVLVTDQRNRLLLSNPAAWRTLGEAMIQGQGQPIAALITQKSLLDILQTTSSDKLSAEVLVPGGDVYLATASPVVADGQLMGRVCILRDVTHFKELDIMKTEFVNTVSHDLRSPLTLMRGYATMLEMVGELNEQQKGYVNKMIVGVENMTRLVNNLLDLGRIDVGVGLRLETVLLQDIIEHVVTTLQMQATQKDIQLDLELPHDTSPLIQADQALLQQAIYNLVENALKYTPNGGQVTVRLKIQGDSMLFSVQDTGIGVSAVDQARLFEKFYRGTQREAREQKGSGLGLAIVKSIAEKHGGKVWLKSELGKGSTFFLQVPLQQPK